MVLPPLGGQNNHGTLNGQPSSPPLSPSSSSSDFAESSSYNNHHGSMIETPPYVTGTIKTEGDAASLPGLEYSPPSSPPSTNSNHRSTLALDSGSSDDVSPPAPPVLPHLPSLISAPQRLVRQTKKQSLVLQRIAGAVVVVFLLAVRHRQFRQQTSLQGVPPSDVRTLTELLEGGDDDTRATNTTTNSHQMEEEEVVDAIMTAWCVLDAADKTVNLLLPPDVLHEEQQQSFQDDEQQTSHHADAHALFPCWSYFERIREQHPDQALQCGLWFRHASLWRLPYHPQTKALIDAMGCRVTQSDPRQLQRRRRQQQNQEKKDVFVRVNYNQDTTWFQMPKDAISLRKTILRNTDGQDRPEGIITPLNPALVSIGLVMDHDIRGSQPQASLRRSGASNSLSCHDARDVLRELETLFGNNVNNLVHIDHQPISMHGMSLAEQAAWWYNHTIVFIEHGSQVVTNMAFLPIEGNHRPSAGEAASPAAAIVELKGPGISPVHQAMLQHEQQHDREALRSLSALARSLGIKYHVVEWKRGPSNHHGSTTPRMDPAMADLVRQTAQELLQRLWTTS